MLSPHGGGGGEGATPPLHLLIIAVATEGAVD